jgi:IclR family transcriptional regulator, pca regulon regulatory protein
MPKENVNLAKPERVAALERGLELIRCLSGEAHTRSTLAELARATARSRAATRRFLLSLQTLGYIETDGRYFQLRREILDLGHAYLSSLPWWRPAERAVARLSIALNTDCSACVLDRGRVTTVASSAHERFSAFERETGLGEPAFASAAGRVLLAHLELTPLEQYLQTTPLRPLTPFTLCALHDLRAALERARVDGRALATQEIEIGVNALAVPIYDRSEQVVAALCAHYPASDGRDPVDVADALETASNAITAEAVDE